MRPSRQARTWSHDGAQDGRDGVRRRRRRGRDDHRFASYYGKPIINLPVWNERDSDGLGVGLFEAGMASARDPRYTVEPQRERLNARGEPDAPTEGS